MSEVTRELPELEIDEELWIDLEIPYGKIREKWDQRYERELRILVEKNIIGENILGIYLALFDIHDAKDRKDALDKILDEDERLGYNLLCLKQFSDYKKAAYFKQFQGFLDGHCVDTPLHGSCLALHRSDNKLGLAALLQLFDSDGTRLKTIRGLDYCDKKKPQLVSADPDADSFDLEAEADKIVREIGDGDFREYQKWHVFEYEGRQHVMIKREIDDRVERQAGRNIEEEPAEFIVLRYSEGDLEIISSTKEIAGRARSGVNSSVPNVEFTEVDAGVSHDELEETVGGLLGREEPELDSEELTVERDRLTITGLKVSSSPFPGHPSITMKTEAGIIATINKLQELNYDLLENIDDVDVIYTKFDGREYSLRPKERHTDDQIYWTFKYDAHAPPREEREDFETLVGELFGVDVIFEQT